jgi:hypothetical protein
MSKEVVHRMVDTSNEDVLVLPAIAMLFDDKLPEFTIFVVFAVVIVALGAVIFVATFTTGL